MKKIVLNDQPPVPSEINNPDVLAAFICTSLGLVPRRGKGDVAVALLKIFTQIAGRRDETINVGGKNIRIHNGAVKIEDLHHWLRSVGVNIGMSSLYSTYIALFLERGIIVKKKHSMYGLRADRLEDALMEMERDAHTLFDKLREHARRLSRALSENV